MKNRLLKKMFRLTVLTIIIFNIMTITGNSTIYYFVPDDLKETTDTSEYPTMLSDTDIQFSQIDITQIQSIIETFDNPEHELIQLVLAIQSMQQITYIDQYFIGSIDKEDVIQWLNDLGCAFQEERYETEIELFMTDHILIEICTNEPFGDDADDSLHSISLLVRGTMDENEEAVVYTYLF